LDLRDTQEIELFKLVRAAKDTPLGQKHRLSDLQRYEDFAEEVPIFFYSDISDKIEQLKKGKENYFWPEKISRFAVSAGTSGKGKHLPLTNKRLDADRRFMRKVAWNYIRQRPNIFRLLGKHISLPGTLEKRSGFEIGEISAFTAQQAPWWLSPFQLVDTYEMTQLSFNQKTKRILDEAIDKDIRVITSVPSWLLTIFQQLLERTMANSIAEIWPNLQLLVCGGVKLANYRSHLQQLLKKPEVNFIETYGASEGYFAFSDSLNKDDLKLVIDNGIFYEFIPNPLPDKDSLSIQEAVPVWKVEPGIPYAMLVSTNAGLWRYALNDIVQFTQTDPPRIEVMGRVSEMLDDYGEALYAYEAEQALQKASTELDLDIGTFTIAALLENKESIPHHCWFIQTYNPIHRDTLNHLAQKLDKILQENNRHYSIRRESNALDMPEINSINQQQINNWLKAKGKQKAQGKLPSILKDKEDIRFFR
jgi:phenylacetate-coenzyme A ligase PaaK-like adenylate-forming protein